MVGYFEIFVTLCIYFMVFVCFNFIPISFELQSAWTVHYKWKNYRF